MALYRGWLAPKPLSPEEERAEQRRALASAALLWGVIAIAGFLAALIVDEHPLRAGFAVVGALLVFSILFTSGLMVLARQRRFTRRFLYLDGVLAGGLAGAAQALIARGSVGAAACTGMFLGSALVWFTLWQGQIRPQDAA
jgi:hypothetical protein